MSDILVVASKIKKYIKEKAQMSTSASSLQVLTEAVQALCDKGIENARQDGRKTVMDRDLKDCCGPSSSSAE
ncbi:MAG: hypothetical protein Q7S00_06145 [bacterium]|nr:hypothetical protein [bacterium]